MRIRALSFRCSPAVAAVSCATAGRPVETDVADGIRTGTGASVRFGAQTPEPAGGRPD